MNNVPRTNERKMVLILRRRGEDKFTDIGDISDISPVEEETEPNTGQSSDGDNCEKFKAGTYSAFVCVPGFDCSQYEGGKGGEPISPPASLWQRKYDWYSRNKPADHKGDANLDAL